MAITINAIKCPSCGADLPIEEGREKIFCSFCGTPIVLTNENEYIYRHIDEAGIKKAEADKLVELKKLELLEKKQEEKARRKSIKLKISIILGAAGVLCFFIGYAADMEGFLMPGMLCVLILMYMWIFSMGKDNKDDDDEDIVLGRAIRLPAGVDEYENKSYQALEAKFKSAGFSYIQCIPLHDLTTGFLKKPNMVESITVNGEDIDKMNSRAKVAADSTIVISYHSF